jgi:preprotein translocase subunit SecA
LEAVEKPTELENVQYQHTDYDEALASPAAAEDSAPFEREGVKIGRNDPCHCGSGQKYKQCHGKLS